jgi:hypothetical protein
MERGARWGTLRLLLLTSVLSAAVGAAVAGLAVAFIARSSHFTYVSAADLNLRSARSFNVNAGHVRLVGRDGNFELEHETSIPASTLRAYDVGTGKRTPVQIGYSGDGEDVVALRVAGTPGQRNDLQQWTDGKRVLAAIDGKGGLRLGAVTLTTEVRSGVPYLIARTRSGEAFALRLAAVRGKRA